MSMRSASRSRRRAPTLTGRSSARIAAERARRGRAPTRRRGKAGPSRARFLCALVGMALLGFFTVYVADGLSRAFAEHRFGEYTAAKLGQKLLDRLLDRDVPRPAAERRRPSEKPKQALPNKPAAEPPNDEGGGRAELEALDPKAYARESRGLDERRPVEEPSRKAERQDRIAEILRKVGVPE